MTTILFSFLLITCSLSSYLIGFLRGKKGQKQVINHIYEQKSDKEKKQRGFAPKEEIPNQVSRKLYRIN